MELQMTTPDPDPGSFDELRGTLPSHDQELAVAHQSSTVSNTPATGAGRGPTDEQKYGGGIC
jgi:hypothetical protein